jgi:outer membrane protein OmpA-like peptidoglycan-associated protein
MCSTDRRASRRAGRLAAAAAATLAAGCAHEPAGLFPSEEVIGLAAPANIRVQAGGPPAADRLIALAAEFEAAAPDAVYFGFDRADLNARAEAAARAQAAWLRAHPGALVRVYGHTDLVGSERYNEALGLRRARALARELVEGGVAPGRIRLVASLGETEPVVPVAEREPRNRRAVTRVEGYGAGWAGGGFDGQRALLVYERYITDQVEEPEVETGIGGE